MDDMKLFQVQCVKLSKGLKLVTRDIVRTIKPCDDTSVAVKAIYDLSMRTGECKERIQVNFTKLNGKRTPSCTSVTIKPANVMNKYSIEGYSLDHLVGLFNFVSAETSKAISKNIDPLIYHGEIEAFYNRTLRELLDGYGIRLCPQVSVHVYRDRIIDITVTLNHI